MNHPRRLLTALILLVPGLSLQAQEDFVHGAQLMDPPPIQQPSPGFPVTGRMICADTQRAARFAQVTLLPASQEGGPRLTARTDLDGNFLIPNARPGDYYVTGSLPGYVNQTQMVQNILNAGSSSGSAAPNVPLVHVTAGGASAAVSLQRGGTLAGTVTWDDGTPAAGVGVAAQPAAANGTSGAASQPQSGFGRGFGGFAGAQTDDRGRFRLSGLAPGSYYLRASVQAPVPQRPGDALFTRTLNLSVYAPDKVRRTDASPVSVSAGEEHSDIAVVLGLAGLHTVSGVITASAAAVRSGSINLTDQTDSSLSRNGVINSDGSFTIPYVPPGTYTLRVTANSQPQASRGDNSSAEYTRFQPVQESITVTDTDLTGLSITVTTATASQ